MTFRVEPLTGHDVSEFSCGDADLDDWLRRHAHTARGQGTRTYVVVDDAGEVVGYFAITPHLLARSDAAQRLARGAPIGSRPSSSPNSRSTPPSKAGVWVRSF